MSRFRKPPQTINRKKQKAIQRAYNSSAQEFMRLSEMHKSLSTQIVNTNSAVLSVTSSMNAMLYKFEEIRRSFSELCQVTNAINGVRDQAKQFGDLLNRMSTEIVANKNLTSEYLADMHNILRDLNVIAEDPLIVRTMDDLREYANQMRDLIGEER